MFRATPAAMEDLIAMLPAHVRELAIDAHVPQRLEPDVIARAIDPLVRSADRFDVVEIRTRDATSLARLLPALPTSAPHASIARVHQLGGPCGLVPGCVLGSPADAALVSPMAGIAMVLPRAALLVLQNQFGVVPVRTQLAGSLPERHLQSVLPDALIQEEHALFRRGDRWTFRAMVDDPIVEVTDGVPFGPHGYVLVTTDLDRRCRALVSRT